MSRLGVAPVGKTERCQMRAVRKVVLVVIAVATAVTVNLTGGGTADISYRATVGNTGTDDYGFDVFLEHAPASTGGHGTPA